MGRLQFDEIGFWSELKIEIIKKYAAAYAAVLSTQKQKFHRSYIDGFSGPGEHRRKGTGERVLGSPLEVLDVEPVFDKYFFVDLNGDKIEHLRSQIGNRVDVEMLVGDTNKILPTDVFPQIDYRRYCRALCLLDPYGLHLDWSVIQSAGASKSIEIFLNFPTADMQRNVFWRNPEGVDPADIIRMNNFWGDQSWRSAAYQDVPDLFGPRQEKTEMQQVVNAFRERLKKVGGFEYVPEPVPMKNNQGAIVYFLFFASQNKTGARIATDIFKRYR